MSITCRKFNMWRKGICIIVIIVCSFPAVNSQRGREREREREDSVVCIRSLTRCPLIANCHECVWFCSNPFTPYNNTDMQENTWLGCMNCAHSSTGITQPSTYIFLHVCTAIQQPPNCRATSLSRSQESSSSPFRNGFQPIIQPTNGWAGSL